MGDGGRRGGGGADACLLDFWLAFFDTLVLERCCSPLAMEKYPLPGGRGLLLFDVLMWRPAQVFRLRILL